MSRASRAAHDPAAAPRRKVKVATWRVSVISNLMLFIAAALIFLAVDLVWLGFVAKSIYVAEIGGLLRKRPDLLAAGAFYLLYIAGLTLFVTRPALADGGALRAMLMGGAFGLVAYATYDLTNLATLEGFTARIALIDMAWGTFVTALAAGGAVAIVSRLG